MRHYGILRSPPAHLPDLRVSQRRTRHDRPNVAFALFFLLPCSHRARTSGTSPPSSAVRKRRTATGAHVAGETGTRPCC